MIIDEKLRTEKITPELIEYIVEKIVRKIQPEKIILYGSYARGDFHKDSDIDLPHESIGKKEANEAIEAAEQIEQFVLNKLPEFKRP
jgi:predicted nucleotidyltransferase